MPASRTTVATTMMRRHGSVPSGSRAVLLPSHHPAARAGRSIFPSRVFDPDELPALLKSGHNSRKIGRQVTKGPCKGQPIYTLTLEERASCPRSCREWLGCYGNNMQAAERVVHAPPLIAALRIELAALAARHPAGFLVRLHVLGDFWSVEYVDSWADALARHPGLTLFGFTSHAPASPIAKVATGTPLGICTMDSNESSPRKYFEGTGTPNTGTSVSAAIMPGKCAAPPAPAIMARKPRPAAAAP